ncbi:MAG: hypothetical protein Q8L89_07260 [Gammaproteobacteria bacterium]|nr:hypothetical protein [Gammaproteobacteria bacterium]
MTTVFWLMAAGLTLVALASLILPLYRTTGATGTTGATAATESAIQRRRWPMVGLLAAAPALALGLYLYLGAPAIIEAQQLSQAHGKRDVDAMLAALEASLKTNPEDAEGWHVLGQSYIVLERIGEAEAALAKAVKLAPKEARYLSQYAEALALASGNLEGRPLELVNEALELNFEDEKALELAGLAAYQRQELALAAHFWRRLLKLLPPESEFHQSIQAVLIDAENKTADASGLGDRARLQAAPKKSNPH